MSFRYFSVTIMLCLGFVLSHATSISAQNQPDYRCWGLVTVVMKNKLPAGVAAISKATASVPLKKVIPGDLVFFNKFERMGCPNGIVGLVTHVQKGVIIFVTWAANPNEQVIVLPTNKNYKGNLWYQFVPKIRTFEPKTDPPRPGEKGYKPINNSEPVK